MPDGRKDNPQGGVEGPRTPQDEGGYAGGEPEFGRGYGRDFAGGRDQGFDGSWGQGYGASLAPSDYRDTAGAYGGFSASDYARSFGGRGEDIASDVERSWMDVCADDECMGRPHHRGRGPKGWSRSDQQVYEAVCERLTRDRLIDARGFEVDVEEGVVTLRGLARAPADPRHAAELVRSTPGVKDVRLELTLAPPGLTGERDWRHLFADDHVDKSSFSPPILAGRAPPPRDLIPK
jgi:hypothetical protein